MPVTPTTRVALYARPITAWMSGSSSMPSGRLQRPGAGSSFVVEEFVDEGISGTKARPSLYAMLEACRLDKVDVVAFFRSLMTMADELHHATVQRKAKQIDEALYLDLYGRRTTKPAVALAPSRPNCRLTLSAP